MSEWLLIIYTQEAGHVTNQSQHTKNHVILTVIHIALTNLKKNICELTIH